MIIFYLARADNGVIGQDGTIPWRIPGEQRRFKEMTMGKPMIMGRKTFESFPAPLPGRRHIVLTRDPGWTAAGAEVARTREQAIALVGAVPEIAVIGGAEIFRLFEDVADAVELTEVHLSPEGDAVVPAFGSPLWREVSREDLETHSFVRLEKA
ncbi:MAG TPA: dihydrofolate reductase [Allosphingosinicella sp.]|nr:dihydrofolate reductase [Allosphingosinicella sp.]